MHLWFFTTWKFFTHIPLLYYCCIHRSYTDTQVYLPITYIHTYVCTMYNHRVEATQTGRRQNNNFASYMFGQHNSITHSLARVYTKTGRQPHTNPHYSTAMDQRKNNKINYIITTTNLKQIIHRKGHTQSCAIRFTRLSWLRT